MNEPLSQRGFALFHEMHDQQQYCRSTPVQQMYEKFVSQNGEKVLNITYKLTYTYLFSIVMFTFYRMMAKNQMNESDSGVKFMAQLSIENCPRKATISFLEL